MSINISRLRHEDTSITDLFLDSATWTGQHLAGCVGPTGKCERRLSVLLFRSGVSEEIAVSRRRLSGGLGIRRAAVFAEPAVTKIEEVVCLVQGRQKVSCEQ